jgi:diguanylate cyclase (GGDEF)-like protein
VRIEEDLTTGLSAGESQAYLEFKSRLFSSIMIIAVVFAAAFGLMHDLGLNQIGRFHAYVDYLYSSLTLVLLFLFKKERSLYTPILYIFLAASFLTFISAFINVPVDQFRAIWFYLLVLVAYILAGTWPGVGLTAFSIVAVLSLSQIVDVGLSDESMVSIVVGLLIFSLIAFIYTNRTDCYANQIEENNSKLKQLASEDPLTGLFNPRMCTAIGEQLLKMSIRDGNPLSVIYTDLDHFKKINDTYGHQAGDQVLVHVADIVNGFLRQSDVCARLGGEEFCVVLPETDSQAAAKLAEKMRQRMEQTIEHIGEVDLHITASFGVAQMLPTDQSLSDIQKRADQALYAAKKMGRNRVIAE